MKTLVIPDIHHRWQLAAAIINYEKIENIVFLGDYFDQFGDTPDHALSTAAWLKAEMKKPNRTFLWGNHDTFYRYPSNYTNCSGNTQSKLLHINSVLTCEDWDKLQWFKFVDGWLISHGGLHPSFLPAEMDGKPSRKDLEAWLEDQVTHATKQLEDSGSHWFFRAGFSRGGSQKVGGLNWLDFDDEFVAIPGINQLVGHTNQYKTYQPVQIKTNDSINHCIDADNKFYAIIEPGGKLDIREIPSKLKPLQRKFS